MKYILFFIVTGLIMPLVAADFDPDARIKAYGKDEIEEPIEILSKTEKYLIRPWEVQEKEVLKGYIKDMSHARFLLKPILTVYEKGAEESTSIKEASLIERIGVHYVNIDKKLTELTLLCYYNLGMLYEKEDPLRAALYFQEVLLVSDFKEEGGLRLRAETRLKRLLGLEKLESYPGD